MNEILENLEKIRGKLGKVNVSFDMLEHERGEMRIAVYWRDGSDYRVSRNFSPIEIKAAVDDAVFVDGFIAWAKRMKEAAVNS